MGWGPMSVILLTLPPCDIKSVTDTYWEVSQAGNSLYPSLYTTLMLMKLMKPHSTVKLLPAAFVLNKGSFAFFW